MQTFKTGLKLTIAIANAKQTTDYIFRLLRYYET